MSMLHGITLFWMLSLGSYAEGVKIQNRCFNLKRNHRAVPPKRIDVMQLSSGNAIDLWGPNTPWWALPANLAAARKRVSTEHQVKQMTFYLGLSSCLPLEVKMTSLECSIAGCKWSSRREDTKVLQGCKAAEGLVPEAEVQMKNMRMP